MSSINAWPNSREMSLTPVNYRGVWILRRIFFVELIAGVGMLGMGLLLVPAIPYVLLDVVLTPDELRNEAVVDRTLWMLGKTVPLHMTAWILAGTCLIGTSIVGRRIVGGIPTTVATAE